MRLHELMVKYGSDKADHGFCEFYESYFGPIRESVKAFLEIGVFRGSSMRAWLDYFPNARIVGIDDGAWQSEWSFNSRPAQIYMADQGARTMLREFVRREDTKFDMILDDGSHTMWGQQVSLACLLQTVKEGGFYCVEDLHTSFEPVVGYINQKGKPNSFYATGADFPLTTTFDVLDQWPDLKSDYMTAEEWDYLVGNVANVTIFDRDNDHKHMTAVLEVT